MLFSAALLFVVVACSPLLGCRTTCERTNVIGHVEGQCPVKMTSVPFRDPEGSYSERVTVHVWLSAEDICAVPKIEIRSLDKVIIRPTIKKSTKNKTKCENEIKAGEIRVKCRRSPTHQQPRNQNSVATWEVIYDCVTAEAHTPVYVFYTTASTSCNVSHTVSEPTPDFHLSVNQTSKSVSVFVESGDKVYAKVCYKQAKGGCIGESAFMQIIDPSQARSAVLNIRYTLPCVCVQVYYTHMDARRDTRCLFQNETFVDVTDYWLSSRIILYRSSLEWFSVCPARDHKVSAALCWRQSAHLCTPVINSTLQGTENGHIMTYKTSAVDRHPQMCVQFSLQGSHRTFCLFHSEQSSWSAHIEKGRQSLSVCLTSSVTANFSAQLCFLTKRECTPKGPVHSVTVEVNPIETRINVPLRFPAEKPCVQVWQSDPPLQGKRILCPDYTHHRCGMYAVAALVSVVIVALLGIVAHRLTNIQAAGWLYVQKPVLLVCSSEQSSHVSAVCALASILQGELRAAVHLSLWAQNSQKSGGSGTGLADVGPLPWLYGQWEAVSKAQGKVLLVWSPEAKRSYVKWRAKMGKTEHKKESDNKTEVRLDESWKESGRRLGKCKNQKSAGKHDAVHTCNGKEVEPRNAHSSVIAPVFTAALACLERALQECKGQRVVFVYFQGLGHSRDIPKAFRGVPRYCLPQDFRGLIQELAEPRQQTQSGKPRPSCWPRLLSKVFSIWLARRLAHRLRTMLPEARGKKVPGPKLTSSQEMMSERTHSRLKLPSAAKMSTVQEQEPLCGSPHRGGEV